MSEERDSAGAGYEKWGEELRAHREAAGWTQEELAHRMGWSTSVIARLETGRARPLEEHAAKADEVFSLPRSFQRLRETVAQARIYPDWFKEWPAKEAAARLLRWFELLLIPGLLQTEEYARALMAKRLEVCEDYADEVVAGRMERQSILAREQPPQLRVVLDEAALRRPIGSPKVMHGQVGHLIEMAGRPHICLQVIPADVASHEGVDGAGFVIADYSVAYVETAAHGMMMDRAEDVAALVRRWDNLRAEALPRSTSLDLLEEVARSWT